MKGDQASFSFCFSLSKIKDERRMRQRARMRKKQKAVKKTPQPFVFDGTSGRNRTGTPESTGF
jgi:hypothetical protein